MDAPIKPVALIIGGTSGLGYELAHLLKDRYDTYITGRKNPHQDELNYLYLDLSHCTDIQKCLDDFVATLPQINLLVYAAGFYQEGKISELSDGDINDMLNVGLVAPTLLLNRICKKQKLLPGFIAITSTSQ